MLSPALFDVVLLHGIYTPHGYRFQKVGIVLNDFCDRPGQIDMFDESPPRPNSEALMGILDHINTTGMGKV